MSDRYWLVTYGIRGYKLWTYKHMVWKGDLCNLAKRCEIALSRRKQHLYIASAVPITLADYSRWSQSMAPREPAFTPERWQDIERTVTSVEQVYATRYDCIADPGGARRIAA